MSTDFSRFTDDEIEVLVAEAMGWVKDNLSFRKTVDDDGCLGSNGCSHCNRGCGARHDADCEWLELHRIWVHPDVERWEDTGDPKCYHHVAGWKPSSRCESFENVKREIERRWNLWDLTWRKGQGPKSFEFCIYPVDDEMPIVIVRAESEMRAGCEAFLQAVEICKERQSNG